MLPIPLIVAGALVLLGIIGLAIALNAKSSHIEIQPDKPISPVRRIFLAISLVLLFAGLSWGIIIGIKASNPQPVVTATSFAVHLVNVGYMTDGWRPVSVDLRTASTEGVALYPGQLLRLFDIRVSCPELPDREYKVQVEAYANNADFMGKTAMTDLSPNVTVLGEIVPEKFRHPNDTTNWQAQPDWKEIVIYVILYDQSGKGMISKESATIKLIQSESRSWWLSPPYAKIVSVVYQINDGEKISMDLRTIESEGIHLNLGDTLKVSEVWYHSLENGGNKQIQVYVYFKPGPGDDYPNRGGPLTPIFSGAYNLLPGDPLTWRFTKPQDQMIIDLYRSDGLERYTVLDEYVIPIKLGQ